MYEANRAKSTGEAYALISISGWWSGTITPCFIDKPFTSQQKPSSPTTAVSMVKSQMDSVLVWELTASLAAQASSGLSNIVVVVLEF